MRTEPVSPYTGVRDESNAARVDRTDIFTRSSFSTKNRSTTFYVGRAYVEYEFSGRAHRSVITLRNSSSDRATVEQLLARIRVGDSRVVRVDPDDPYRILPVDAWPLVLPAVFLGTGAVMMSSAVLVWRPAPQARQTAFAVSGEI